MSGTLFVVVVFIHKHLGIAVAAGGQDFADIFAGVFDELAASWADCVAMIALQIVSKRSLAVGDKMYLGLFAAHSAGDGAAFYDG